jgi:hypothetical protein
MKQQTDATFDSFYFLSNYLLNMFRATSAHHQEFSLLYIQPPVICVVNFQQDSATDRQQHR